MLNGERCHWRSGRRAEEPEGKDLSFTYGRVFYASRTCGLRKEPVSDVQAEQKCGVHVPVGDVGPTPTTTGAFNTTATFAVCVGGRNSLSDIESESTFGSVYYTPGEKNTFSKRILFDS